MAGYGIFGPLVGAIDEGTSSARFIIFKANSSEVVAYHQKELKQHFPQEGWVEQDPMDILEVVKTCIEKAVEKLVSLGGKPKVSTYFLNYYCNKILNRLYYIAAIY